ncbi:MAG: hypothetical protein K2M60_11600 [Lachnospiraceae bacterium]|nr:hypothetical protein [Lachnospiraceae bacterium]MDE6252893.1 hypothetical protein [Lachnospiraceae bacterium]
MENIRDVILEIIKEISGIEIISDEQELNLTSFDTLKIVIKIEQELDVCIDDGKIFRGIFNNINTLEKYIKTLV